MSKRNTPATVTKTVTLQEVLATLPRLSSAERTLVLTRCRALDSLEAPASRSASKQVSGDLATDRLLDTIREVLAIRGLPTFVPKSGQGYKRLTALAPDIDAWLRSLLPAGSRTEMVALSKIAVKSLVKKVERFRPVNAGALIQHLDEIADAFDEQWPSYISNGWVPVLIRMMSA